MLFTKLQLCVLFKCLPCPYALSFVPGGSGKTRTTKLTNKNNKTYPICPRRSLPSGVDISDATRHKRYGQSILFFNFIALSADIFCRLTFEGSGINIKVVRKGQLNTQLGNIHFENEFVHLVSLAAHYFCNFSVSSFPPF